MRKTTKEHYRRLRGALEIKRVLFREDFKTRKIELDAYYPSGHRPFSGVRSPNKPIIAFNQQYPVFLFLIFPSDKLFDVGGLLYGCRVPEEHIGDLVGAVSFIKKKCLDNADWDEETKRKMNKKILATGNPFLIYAKKKILRWGSLDEHTNRIESITRVKGLFQKIVFGHLSYLFVPGEAVRTIRLLVDNALIASDVHGLAWSLWSLRKKSPDSHFDPAVAIREFVSAFRAKKWPEGDKDKRKELEALCKKLEEFLAEDRNTGKSGDGGNRDN